jgi:hypothetical protein
MTAKKVVEAGGSLRDVQELAGFHRLYQDLGFTGASSHSGRRNCRRP